MLNAQSSTNYNVFNNIVQYNEKNAGISSSVYKSYKDSNGILWLATKDGVVYYDGKKFTNLMPKLKTKIAKSNVTLILKYTQDTLVFSDFFDYNIDVFLVNIHTKKITIKKSSQLKFANTNLNDTVYTNEFNSKDTIKKSALNRMLYNVYRLTFDYNAVWLYEGGKNFLFFKNGSFRRIELKDFDIYTELVRSVDGKLIHLKIDGTVGIYNHDANAMQYSKCNKLAQLFKGDERAWLNTYFMCEENSNSICLKKNNDIYQIDLSDSKAVQLRKIVANTDMGATLHITYEKQYSTTFICTQDKGFIVSYQPTFANFTSKGLSSSTEDIFGGLLHPISPDSIITHIGLLTTKGKNVPLPSDMNVLFQTASLIDSTFMYMCYHDRHDFYFAKMNLDKTLAPKKLIKLTPNEYIQDFEKIDNDNIAFVTSNEFYLILKDNVYKYYKYQDSISFDRIKYFNDSTILAINEDGKTYKLNIYNGNIQLYEKYKELPISDIITHNNINYILTKNEGVYLDKNNNLKKLNIAYPLKKLQLIGGFFDKNGRCWLLSAHGIYSISEHDMLKNFEKANHAIALQNYNESFQLTQNDLTSVVNPYYAEFNKYYYIPTSSGISRFHADSMPIQAIHSEILIDNITLQDSSITIQQLRSLPYNFKDLSLSVSVPYLGNPENLVIQYKLEGFDNDWMYMPDNMTLQYTTLPSGAYKLLIRYPYFDIEANESKWKTKTVAIEVEKPWYNTWWFYSLLLMATILISIIIIRYRTHQIQKRNKELETAIENRTMDLQYSIRDLEMAQLQMYRDQKMNENLARTVLHDIGTPLTFINWVSNKLRKNNAIKDNTELQHEIDSISNSVSQIDSICNDLLVYMKTKNENIQLEDELVRADELLEKAIGFQRWIAHEKGLHFVVNDQAIKNKKIKLNAQIVEIILRNIIDNAVKYTSKGDVSIYAAINENNELEIEVKDMAKGFDSKVITSINQQLNPFENLQKGKNGFKLIMDLLKLVQGKISLQSEPNQGSKFKLAFPAHTDWTNTYHIA